GFIGCGTHSTNNLYPMLAYANCRLSCVCDLNESLARRNASLYGDASTKAYADAGRMLDEERVDGLMIVGPPAMHHRYGMEALRRGIPVFVEKPPAPSLAEAAEMVGAAKAGGTFVMCGFMKRFGSAYKKVREMVGTGGLSLSSGYFKYSHWPADDIRMMYGMSIHIIDLAICLFGKVATIHSAYGKPNGRVSVQLSMRHASGLATMLMLDSSHPRIHERVELSGVMEGRNALVIVDNVQHMELHTEQSDYTFIDVIAPTMQDISPTAGFDGIRVWRPDYALPNMGQTRHFFQGFAGEMREFVDAITEGRPAEPSNDSILEAMAVIEAVIARPNGDSVPTGTAEA
ncbi:MAG: Gfo/Idh/MocA family oxidoreductase, partial [Oscillospiraceae bacterium]|nr:Gfo/Idh/MocA family oxidoreductase [Oscillospiraceae bacterium]